MARSHDGQIIKAGKGAEELGRLINARLDQIQLALPTGQDAHRLSRIFLTEVQRIPGLLACTPKSLIGGFLQASQAGLELGSHLGQAWLIPFRVKGVPTATLIIGYKGLVSLAYKSGMVQTAGAYDVREADNYEPPMLGTDPKIVHQPVAGRESSPLVAAYAIVRLMNATVPNIEWMWKDEIEKVKSRSRAAAKKDGPWFTDYSMMARKTALRRVCKYIPQTAESRAMHTAIAVDEQADSNLTQAFDVDAKLIEDLPDEAPKQDTGELTAEQEREAFGD